jgi:ArsR family transcriptional regulator, lead/cadmium/zinc/bismuth-responsive transcriptional repressor
MNICSYEERTAQMAIRAPALDQDACEIEFIDERKVKRARRQMKSNETVGRLAETFKLLGDPTRVKITFAVSQEELCVCDLANFVGASQSAVSHSLRSLTQMKLVRFRKEGKTTYYALDDDDIADLLNVAFRHVEEST